MSTTIAESRMWPGWLAVVASAAALILGQATINIFGATVFLTPVARELGFSRGDISSAIGLSNLVTAFSMPLFGRMVDRFGVRRPLLVSIVLFAVVTASFSTLHASVPMLFLLFAVSGIVGVGHNPGAYSLVVSSWFDRRRGLALGLTLTGVGFGTIFVPRLSGYLIAAYGWRAGYLGLGACLLLLSFIPVLLFVRTAGDCGATTTHQMYPKGFTVAQAWRSRRFWTMAIVFLIVGFAVNGTLIHVVPLLTDRGMSLTSAASVMSVTGATVIIGRLIVGYFMDRVRADILGAVFLLPPTAGILLLVFGGNPYASVALIGLGLGAEIDLLSFYVGRYFGMKNYATLHGLLFAVAVLGNAAGASLLGFAFQKFGSYNIAMPTCSALLVVAAVLLATLGRYQFPAEADFE